MREQISLFNRLVHVGNTHGEGEKKRDMISKKGKMFKREREGTHIQHLAFLLFYNFSTLIFVAFARQRELPKILARLGLDRKSAFNRYRFRALGSREGTDGDCELGSDTGVD